MEVVFALDSDADAASTFKQNRPGATFESRDIRDVTEESVSKRVVAQLPQPVLFSGCAPCQPFIRRNTTRPEPDEDERVPLLQDFLIFIRACEPDIVFVENVAGIQDVRPTRIRPRTPFWTRRARLRARESK